jgi:hypothetical protein
MADDLTPEDQIEAARTACGLVITLLRDDEQGFTTLAKGYGRNPWPVSLALARIAEGAVLNGVDGDRERAVAALQTLCQQLGMVEGG